MAELCLICKEKMYIGEAFKISTTYKDTLVGYVHRSCFAERYPKALKKTGFL